MTNFDVIVIGGGPGGLAAAYGLESAGQSVAVIENNLWGGTCPNRGCDPKKILLAAVEAQAHTQALQTYGLKGVPTIDWPALMASKRSYTKTVDPGTLAGLKASQIATYHGSAHFTGPQSLQVGDDQLTAETIIIATGQRPRLLTIPGHEFLQTSTDFLDLDELPKRVTFLGGGYIAFELAAIANAAGAEVHVVHHNERPLKGFDAEMVQTLMAEMTKNGVRFDLDVEPESIQKTATGLELTGSQGFHLVSDAVFCATGRIPNTDTLALDKGQIASDAHGVVVNDRLQATSNPHVYAIGDVVSRRQPKLTPVAGFEGRYVVGQLTGETGAIEYPAIPTLIYGNPKLAMVGVTSKAAAAEPEKYTVKSLDLTDWFTYRRVREPKAMAKVIVDQTKGTIAGASCLSNEADELINYLTPLVNQQVTAAELGKTIYAYPSVASDLQYFY